MLSEMPKIGFPGKKHTKGAELTFMYNSSALRMQYIQDGVLTKQYYCWYFDDAHVLGMAELVM